MEEVEKVTKEIKGIETEVILINDGSKDETIEVIRELKKATPAYVTYLSRETSAKRAPF